MYIYIYISICIYIYLSIYIYVSLDSTIKINQLLAYAVGQSSFYQKNIKAGFHLVGRGTPLTKKLAPSMSFLTDLYQKY